MKPAARRPTNGSTHAPFNFLKRSSPFEHRKNVSVAHVGWNGAVAWYVSGALGSIPTSAIADITNVGASGGNYVENTIIGCAVGKVGQFAWKLLTPWAKKQVIAAVAAFIINLIR